MATTLIRAKQRRQSSYSFAKPRRSRLLTILTAIILFYSLVPLAWLLINSTKSQEDLL